MRTSLVSVAIIAGCLLATTLRAEEKVRARHILFPETEEAKAKEVLDQLKAGTLKFEDALASSIDVMTKRAGGDLGMFSRRVNMDQGVLDACFKLKVNEFAPAPVKTQFGWHILQVTGREGEPDKPGETPAKATKTPPPKQPIQPAQPPAKTLVMAAKIANPLASAGIPMHIELTLTNESAEAAQVLRPEFWPLGLKFVRTPAVEKDAPLKAAYAESLPAPALVALLPGQGMFVKINAWDVWDNLGQEGWWELEWSGKAVLDALGAKLDWLKADASFAAAQERWSALAAAEKAGFDVRVISPDKKYFAAFAFKDGSRFLVELDLKANAAEAGHFMKLVRKDFYKGKKLDKLVADAFLSGGGLGREGVDWPEETVYVSDTKLDAAQLKAQDFVLVVRQTKYSFEAGSKFMVVLKDLPDYKRTGIPIGKVVGRWDTIERMAAPAAWNMQMQNSIASVRLLLEDQVDASLKGGAPPEAMQVAEPKGPLPKAVIETDQGNVEIELYEDDAPNTVANFISLAEKGFYNGLKFHRIVPGFVIQGGDPEGTGRGGPGYTIKDEVNGRTHVEGAVAMAKMPRPDTAGSQFYICLARTPHLDKDYTVFGKVTSGMEAVRKIESEKAGTMAKVTIAEKRPGSTYAPAKLNEKAPAEPPGK